MDLCPLRVFEPLGNGPLYADVFLGPLEMSFVRFIDLPGRIQSPNHAGCGSCYFRPRQIESSEPPARSYSTANPD
jgi:hypothetical protein